MHVQTQSLEAFDRKDADNRDEDINSREEEMQLGCEQGLNDIISHSILCYGRRYET